MKETEIAVDKEKLLEALKELIESESLEKIELTIKPRKSKQP